MRDPELAISMLREAVALEPAQVAFRVGLAKFLLASNLGGSPEVAETLALLRSGNAHGMYHAELRELNRLLEAGQSEREPD